MSICVHIPVCPCATAGSLALRRSFRDGRQRNFEFLSLCFCVGPPVYSQSCSTASPAAASWQGCDIGIPGDFSPLLTWSSSGFGVKGLPGDQPGSQGAGAAAPAGAGSQRIPAGAHPSLCCASKQRLFAHPAAAMGWLGLGRAAPRVDPARPFSPEHLQPGGNRTKFLLNVNLKRFQIDNLLLNKNVYVKQKPCLPLQINGIIVLRSDLILKFLDCTVSRKERGLLGGTGSGSILHLLAHFPSGI